MKIKVKDALELLKPVLDATENSTVYDTGVRMISGGFAFAEYDGHDNGYYYIKLKWGVQSDVEDIVHTEYYKLPIATLADPNLKPIEKYALLEDA